MGLKLNPFTAQFDLTGSGGGGGSAFFAGEVPTYADLPLDGTAALNSRWLVRSNSGTWPFSSYKQAGVYVRIAAVGSSRDNDYRLTDTSFFDVMSDSAFLIYDDGDATKNLKFQLSGIDTATTRTLTVPNASGTIALTSDITAGLSDGDKGDITVSSSGATWTIDNDAVTNAKLANVATSTIKGRSTAGTGDPEDLTASQVRTILNVADGATANATNAQLRDRSTHTGTQTASTISDFNTAAASAAPVQSVAGRTGTVTLAKADVGLGNVDNTSDANKPVSTATQTALDTKAATSHTHAISDVTGLQTALDGKQASGSYAAASHTHAAADITSGTLDIARIPTGTGSTQVAPGNHTHELTALAATGATNGHVLTANGSGGVTFAAASGGGVTGAAASASDVLGVSGANITGVDANADRIVFWDDSASALKYLEAGSGLSISGTTLTATATGTIGGSTGATDNLLLRSDGTGAATLQNSALQLDDAVTGGTQSNVALINAHSETNSALVLTPKGNGAFIVGPKPDGTTTGGNARGTNSIDIQLTRTAANQVASGTTSVAIGVNSRASSTNSIAIGNFAAASNSPSVAIGPSSTANGESSVAIGENCSAGGLRAVGIGRTADANLRGMLSTIPFNALYWSGQTTNNTATVLGLDGGAGVRFTIAASTALAVDILLVARRATTQDKWLVARRFLGIRRDGSNNTALIGAVQEVAPDQSAGSPTWTYAITADTTNHALQLEVVGATGETVEWRATAFYRVA